MFECVGDFGVEDFLTVEQILEESDMGTSTEEDDSGS